MTSITLYKLHKPIIALSEEVHIYYHKNVAEDLIFVVIWKKRLVTVNSRWTESLYFKTETVRPNLLHLKMF